MTTEKAKKHLNKNQYSYHLPYDSTLVSLSSKNFINASWMKTGICNQKFIATQAPMENTIDDFWQLVFDTKPVKIISLTKLGKFQRDKDGERRGCIDYIQKESVNFTLESKLITENEKFAIRSIQMAKAETSSDLFKTTHIECKLWMDHMMPSDELLKELIQTVIVNPSLDGRDNVDVTCERPFFSALFGRNWSNRNIHSCAVSFIMRIGWRES